MTAPLFFSIRIGCFNELSSPISHAGAGSGDTFRDRGHIFLDGKLLQDLSTTGLGLADAGVKDTNVRIDSWSLGRLC
jgi:hypothetical protein